MHKAGTRLSAVPNGRRADTIVLLLLIDRVVRYDRTTNAAIEKRSRTRARLCVYTAHNAVGIPVKRS